MTPGDREAAQALWTRRFSDSPAFTKWYFDQLFFPETSACVSADGRLVSMALGRRVSVRIRAVDLPVLLIAGVSTEEAYQRRGYMHQCMRHALQLARQFGCAALLYKPQNIAVYASLGHLPVTEAKRFLCPEGPERPVFDAAEAGELLSCYQAVTGRYNCALRRDEADILRRLEDFACDGGGCVTLRRSGYLAAYALLSPAGRGFDAPECLAVDGAALNALISQLPKNTAVKLPPDAEGFFPALPDCIMGAADVPLLLKTFSGDPSVAFFITDPAVEQNNGVFLGTGELCRKEADYALTAGELMRHIAGCRALPGVFSQEACFCLDEY